MGGDLLAKFGIYVCDLNTSKLYLFKEQSHKGRIIVSHNDHVDAFLDLNEEERNAFMADVAKAAAAVQKAYNPDKINYGMYSDTLSHLHVHIVPKYKDGYEWGGVFAMNPGETLLTDGEYEEIIAAIKANL